MNPFYPTAVIGAIIAGLLVACWVPQQPQHEAGVHANHKAKDRGVYCPQIPCTAPPAACFMHGGAPTAPECLRD